MNELLSIAAEVFSIQMMADKLDVLTNDMGNRFFDIRDPFNNESDAKAVAYDFRHNQIKFDIIREYVLQVSEAVKGLNETLNTLTTKGEQENE